MDEKPPDIGFLFPTDKPPALYKNTYIKPNRQNAAIHDKGIAAFLRSTGFYVLGQADKPIPNARAPPSDFQDFDPSKILKIRRLHNGTLHL